MKKIIFIVLGILICYIAEGQYKNIEKFPQKLRDSILIETANKAINKYSTGYLRAKAIPIIQDMGILKKEIYDLESNHLGVYFYTVLYRGTKEEHNYPAFNKEYLIKVYIRADNCRPVRIRYIDDYDWLTTGGLDREEKMNNECTHKIRFTPIEELERIKKNSVRTIIIDTPSEYWRKFDERAKHRRDSVMKEIQKSIELKRKAMEEQQKADSLKSR